MATQDSMSCYQKAIIAGDLSVEQKNYCPFASITAPVAMLIIQHILYARVDDWQLQLASRLLQYEGAQEQHARTEVFIGALRIILDGWAAMLLSGANDVAFRAHKSENRSAHFTFRHNTWATNPCVSRCRRRQSRRNIVAIDRRSSDRKYTVKRIFSSGANRKTTNLRLPEV